MTRARSLLGWCLSLWVGCAPSAAPVRAPTPTSPETSRVASAPHAVAAPRLVLQITVDQLRADLPERLMDRFAEGGFRKLYAEGVVFTRAHFGHAITETAPGHATLFTGAHPREHGIVGNDWLDAESLVRVYAVDDDRSQLVGGDGAGKSPRALLVPTIGDALIAQTDGRARVFAVSEKDRGAVLPGGRSGKAFWLDDAAGAFVTSSYYGDRAPAWLGMCADSLDVGVLSGATWSLSQDAGRYDAPDDQPWEKSFGALGRVFPHALGASDRKQLTKTLKRTPFSDALVLEWVRELLTHEPLGRDDVPDLLSVSLSATDYVGHAFGPESREAEDNLLRLDRTLADLLSLVDQRVGLDRTVIVLSADHGVCESPEWFRARGELSGRVDTAGMLREVNLRLRERFGVAVDLARDYVNPSLWLDEGALQAAGLDREEVARVAASVAQRWPGVSAALTRTELLSGAFPRDGLGPEPEAVAQRVMASVHPVRSGHVYIVPKPQWLLASDEGELTAMHGTPWPYDTHVPLIVRAPGLAAARVDRLVEPRSIAPTLATWLAISPPEGAKAPVLHEALP